MIRDKHNRFSLKKLVYSGLKYTALLTTLLLAGCKTTKPDTTVVVLPFEEPVVDVRAPPTLERHLVNLYQPTTHVQRKRISTHIRKKILPKYPIHKEMQAIEDATANLKFKDDFTLESGEYKYKWHSRAVLRGLITPKKFIESYFNGSPIPLIESHERLHALHHKGNPWEKYHDWRQTLEFRIEEGKTKGKLVIPEERAKAFCRNLLKIPYTNLQHASSLINIVNQEYEQTVPETDLVEELHSVLFHAPNSPDELYNQLKNCNSYDYIIDNVTKKQFYRAYGLVVTLIGYYNDPVKEAKFIGRYNKSLSNFSIAVKTITDNDPGKRYLNKGIEILNDRYRNSIEPFIKEAQEYITRKLIK
tara:strand:- start:2050 stop:3129 length:1080 start_codon:yes stop_codon:yes gene_type:complete